MSNSKFFSSKRFKYLFHLSFFSGCESQSITFSFRSHHPYAQISESEPCGFLVGRATLDQDSLNKGYELIDQSGTINITNTGTNVFKMTLAEQLDYEQVRFKWE